LVRYIGLSWEKTDSGTYDTTIDFYYDAMSERVQLNENVLIPDMISVPAGRRAFLTHQDASGPLEFILDSTIASFFLPAVAGECSVASGVVTTKIVPTANFLTLPAISVTINSLYFNRKIAGAAVKRVTIRSDGGPSNLPMLQAELVGGKESRDVTDILTNVDSFSEGGKVLANTTATLYLADEDETITNEPIKVKSFEITIEPVFKEDPIIGTEGLDPDLYIPEAWRVRVNLTVPYTRGAGTGTTAAGTIQWLNRYMGSSVDANADGIASAVTRVWDLLKAEEIPLIFRAKFDYGSGYTLQIDMAKMVIVEPPDYNEEGKVIKDVGLVLEALYKPDVSTGLINETWIAVIGNATSDTGTNYPGYHA